jgi:hypothetical protein
LFGACQGGRSFGRAFFSDSTAISDSFYNSIKQYNSRLITTSNDSNRLDKLKLTFSKNELADYTALRIAGLRKKTIGWLRKAADLLWVYTKGEISRITTNELRDYVLRKYTDTVAKRTVLNFAKAFFRYLSKTRFDTRYHAFDLYLELPKALKERKHITSRIVTKEDVENVLTAIGCAYENGEIDHCHYLNYRALIIFGALTGQRPNATIPQLTVGQFREALRRDKPVIDIPSDCDKIKMQHYCPLHPQVMDAISPLLNDRDDTEHIFKQLPFERWLRKREIRLINGDQRFVMSDLRKFAEQYGDVIGWDQTNRAYIMTHGVSGIDWKHYKHPLPENVYDVYIQYWKDFEFYIV